MSSPDYYRHLQHRVLFEIAKMAWDGTLEDKIEELPEKLAVKRSGLEKALLHGHIRLALGQPPSYKGTLADSARQALYNWQNSADTIKVIKEACRHCTSQTCLLGCNQGPLACGSEETAEQDNCLACGSCIPRCPLNAIADKAQFVPLINLLKKADRPVIAAIAPAFAGQFGPGVTLGRLRAALQKLGFYDLVEVALFADLLTIKEAFEYLQKIQAKEDYLITSCCCPSWIKLIENRFPHLLAHVAPSVSPMIAAGRVLKELLPGAKVVFIGPCIAKKAEAADPDLAGAIDHVLTFKELQLIFEAGAVNPADFTAADVTHASWGGRVYARTGGVAASMEKTLRALQPDEREFKFTSTSLDGIKECQEALVKISTGEFIGNFIEGMACRGGCVGGPGHILDPREGSQLVNGFAGESPARHPLENPMVAAILHQLGREFSPQYIASWETLKRELLP